MSPTLVATFLTFLLFSPALRSDEAKPLEAVKVLSNDAYWHEVYSGERVPEFHFVVSAQQWQAMHPERGRERGLRGRRPREREPGRGEPGRGEPGRGEARARGGEGERGRPRTPGGMM